MTADRLRSIEDNNIVAADVVDGSLILRRYDGSSEVVSLAAGGGFNTTPVVYSLEYSSIGVSPGSMSALDLVSASSSDLANEAAEEAADLEDLPATLGELSITHLGAWAVELTSGLWSITYNFGSSLVSGLNQYRIQTGTWLSNGVYGESEANVDGFVGIDTLMVPIVTADISPSMTPFMRHDTEGVVDFSCSIYLAKIS